MTYAGTTAHFPCLTLIMALFHFQGIGKYPSKGTYKILFFAFFAYVNSLNRGDWVHVSTILSPKTGRLGEPQCQNVILERKVPSLSGIEPQSSSS
jgi:hypothetical protein